VAAVGRPVARMVEGADQDAHLGVVVVPEIDRRPAVGTEPAPGLGRRPVVFRSALGVAEGRFVERREQAEKGAVGLLAGPAVTIADPDRRRDNS
jgi:hypothetical protein